MKQTVPCVRLQRSVPWAVSTGWRKNCPSNGTVVLLFCKPKLDVVMDRNSLYG